MARGTFAQQAGLLVAIATGLITATALGRTLSLAEFGVYGFVVSLATYLYFAAGTAETAAITSMAAAPDDVERDAAFSRSMVVYGAFGLIAGLLIAAAGNLIVGALSFSTDLTHQARIGALCVGVLTAVGWPLKVFQDLLRARQHFGSASASEALGSVAVAAAVVTLLALDAPLWALIGTGAGMPFFVGLIAVGVVTTTRVPWNLRLSLVRGAELREFLGFSGAMFGVSASDLLINSLDRTIVGWFQSAATLGLYEAATRINAMVRQWGSTFSVTLLPVLSTPHEQDREARDRQIMLRGTKYMLAAVVGPTVTLMVLSDRVLDVWLGERFVAAAPAAAVFLALWLVAPNIFVANTLVVVERSMRQLLIYSWAVAAVNLVLSIVLTATLGLIGVAIGTTAGYLLLLPYFVSFAFAGRGVTVADFARQVWLPVYGIGALLALALLAVRLVIPLDHLPAVLATCACAVVGYWICCYFTTLDSDERALVRRVIGRAST